MRGRVSETYSRSSPNRSAVVFILSLSVPASRDSLSRKKRLPIPYVIIIASSSVLISGFAPYSISTSIICFIYGTDISSERSRISLSVLSCIFPTNSLRKRSASSANIPNISIKEVYGDLTAFSVIPSILIL